jgi:K(+)-stimulated pyrophosphate-energized sodium pump
LFIVLQFVFAVGVLALAFAGYLSYYILKQPIGTPKMKEVFDAIRSGSRAYLKRQYKTITIISLILAFILYFTFDYVGNKGFPVTSIAFLSGTFSSLIAGFFSMEIATRSNSRAAFSAKDNSTKPIKISFYGGLVMGLFNVSLSLLGISILYIIFNNPNLILGFAFGASLSALFAQLGGGIYTKAADVGADLVGKVEAGIPENDPRNPAVIADNVGDNVGDCAGRGADLFESISAENIGAMVLGYILFTFSNNIYFLIFPLLASAIGILGTIFGSFFIHSIKGDNPMKPLRNCVIATTLFVIIAFYFLIAYTIKNINLYYASIVGIVSSLIFLLITEYYTSKKYRPVKEIATASKTGAATNIISGFAVALECTFFPVIVICIAILISYYFGTLFALDMGLNTHLGGVYGTVMATIGILSVAGMILGLDGLGPIADNAAGIAEMSNLGDKIVKRLEPLDAIGNTTKSLTKGYAMASAGLSALLLFQAYLELVHPSAYEIVINIIQPKIIVSIFIGAVLPFIFSSFAIRAVGACAFKVVEDVRMQFKKIKGLMEGKAKPDYSRTVDICTKSAQRGMIIPGLIPVIAPVFLGFTLGADAVAAFLIGATASGFILAMMMNTGGAAWDNAKKYIEEGLFGGKGSDAHKSAVIGDTFGDPQKDTAGPSLHILIKLINTTSLVFAPLFIYAIL